MFRLAYRAGVTMAITAPSGTGFLQGSSALFSVAVSNAFQNGAIVQADTAVHIVIGHSNLVSISTQIAALGGLLFGVTSRYQKSDASPSVFEPCSRCEQF